MKLWGSAQIILTGFARDLWKITEVFKVLLGSISASLITALTEILVIWNKIF